MSTSGDSKFAEGINLGEGVSMVMLLIVGLGLGSSPIKCSQLYGSVRAC